MRRGNKILQKSEQEEKCLKAGKWEKSRVKNEKLS